VSFVNGKLAFIPARSGSKGLADKNIKELNGKPLLAYSIEAAQKSGLFDRVFVSTDSARYAAVAEGFGCEIPFLRASSLSSDTASVWDAMQEAVTYFEKERNEFYDYVCLLQPTSPLRTSGDITGAYQILKKNRADSVVSVTETEHSPLWCNTLDENLSLKDFISPAVAKTPRQQLPKYYRLNGAIYWIKTSLLKNEIALYGKNSYAYIMTQENSIDIDTEIDFKMAEFSIKKM
jgi:CMP-N,N'-diacetyllegionaminic acid synthase